MNKRKLLTRLLPLLILLLAIAAVIYMISSKPERKKPVASEKVWQVNVIQAQPRALSPNLTLYGEVETQALLKAAAPGAGLVSRVEVKPGDRVSQGQLLVAMDPRDFSVARQQARADVTDIEAQLSELDLRHRSNLQTLEEEKNLLELARKEVSRIERLKSNNLSSESALSSAREMLGKQSMSLIARQLEVDRYPSTRKQVQARLARAQARLEETELAAERSEVYAGFDGVVSEVLVSTGDRVRVADVLVSLYPLDSLEIRARVPASYQAEIQQALQSDEPMTAYAEVAGRKLMLTLRRLAGEADPSGIDAYFQVIEGVDNLRIGNLIKVELQRPLQQNVVAVPFRAIYGNNRIFLHVDGRMSAMDVESVGQIAGESGDKATLLVRNPALKAGDDIITTHLPNAVQGLRVKVVPAN